MARYALGNVSAKDLAEETGLAATRIRMILMNPMYNGWIRRHRGIRNETRKPAPWRDNPPVSDELWARVEDVRRSKTRAGGRGRADRVDLLKGLIECVCGRRVRSDGTFADGRHRKLHVAPCAEWGTRARRGRCRNCRARILYDAVVTKRPARDLERRTASRLRARLNTQRHTSQWRWMGEVRSTT